ncbi:hypothetical protein LX36DRAFT_405889 [Colletotrichum falcatum]|nr:hypothetical protein LX36DRAFT_405889 [Colletotrichum falcatum]
MSLTKDVISATLRQNGRTDRPCLPGGGTPGDVTGDWSFDHFSQQQQQQQRSVEEECWPSTHLASAFLSLPCIRIRTLCHFSVTFGHLWRAIVCLFFFFFAWCRASGMTPVPWFSIMLSCHRKPSRLYEAVPLARHPRHNTWQVLQSGSRGPLPLDRFPPRRALAHGFV